MAISNPSTLTEGSDNTDGQTSYATASITPTADALALICFLVDIVDNSADGDPTVSGCNLTWSKVYGDDTGYSGGLGFYVYRGTGSSPSTGAVTMTALLPIPSAQATTPATCHAGPRDEAAPRSTQYSVNR